MGGRGVRWSTVGALRSLGAPSLAPRQLPRTRWTSDVFSSPGINQPPSARPPAQAASSRSPRSAAPSGSTHRIPPHRRRGTGVPSVPTQSPRGCGWAMASPPRRASPKPSGTPQKPHLRCVMHQGQSLTRSPPGDAALQPTQPESHVPDLHAQPRRTACPPRAGGPGCHRLPAVQPAAPPGAGPGRAGPPHLQRACSGAAACRACGGTGTPASRSGCGSPGWMAR